MVRAERRILPHTQDSNDPWPSFTLLSIPSNLTLKMLPTIARRAALGGLIPPKIATPSAVVCCLSRAFGYVGLGMEKG